MNDAEYEQIIEQSVKKIIALSDQKTAIDIEVAKLQQFVYATANLLSAEAQARFHAKWQPYVDKLTVIVASLTESIRQTLRGCYPKLLTSAQVRDQLRVEGFDFSSYQSDPLASVSTTLRRLKESGEVDSEEFEGVAVYRAKPQKASTKVPPDHPVNRLRWGNKPSNAAPKLSTPAPPPTWGNKK